MTGLTARISATALAANAQRAAAQSGADAVADLRRDAFGHGVPVVARALAVAGIRFARTDDDIAPTSGVASTTADTTIDSALLYGFPGSAGDPAMTLVGTVLSTKTLLAGEGVSYNYTHVAERDTRIALVTGGFGQGVVRGIGNAARVDVAGAVRPIIGRVAMDVCVVDIADLTVADGDEVTFFGGDGPARDGLAAWSSATGLTASEIVCALGLRVGREQIP